MHLIFPIFVFTLEALACCLQVPAEMPVVLTVAGAVDNEQGQVEYTLADLEAMDFVEVRTSTPWTEGTQIFGGVLLQTILRGAGARGDIVDAIALDDLKATIPWKEIEEFPIIVAFKNNGDYMRVRDKGPLWIIYPLDDYPELRTLERENRMVWQLRMLIVR